MRSCNKDDSSSHYQLCLCGSFNPIVDDGIEKQHKNASASVAVEPDEPPGLESLHSQDFIHFKTRNLVYKQLLEAMEHNYMTGIHGIRGIGKTTLAKQVCLKLHKSIKFDLVIFITVSKKSSSDMKEIQDMIAEKVGLSLKGKNEWERTETITKRLMNGETILLILDDVREHLNSQELGIPSRPDNNMKCKVLVTSREERYCKLLGCHRSIQVDKLSMRDALMSFEKHVGISDNSSKEVQDLGKQIAEAWEGLPIIAAIASILKGRPHQVWKKTSSYLRRKYYLKGYGFDEGWFKAYAFLNFRYEDLDIEKAQMLSILLSMFPLNREVSVEMLTRLGIGVGLFCEVEKYSEVRSEILRLKDILIHSHVWFEDEGGNIKMNDPIWHMIRADELSLCKIEYNRNKRVLSTIEKNIHYVYYDDLRVEEMELDLIPSWCEYDGTKVEMLVVNVEAANSVEVPDAFFEKMTRLQVLSLSSNDLHPMLALKLPSSLGSLTNIRSLLLSHWKFSDISIIGELQSLDTLDFDDCSISEFPKEISALKLRLLSLKRCQIEMNNPFKVIERCLTLQELYYNDNEVSTLDSVNEAEEIYQSETFPTLNRYHLQQGEADASRAKCVRLRNIDDLVSEATFKYLIKGAEILHLKEIQGGWRNLIPEIVPSMNDVVELCLESCSNVECLVNTQSHVVSAFSKLVELKLSCMDNLKQLCSGEDHPSDFLKSLNRLSIEHCVHLQGILFKSKVNLCNLKSINLFHCQELTSLFMLSTAKSLVLLEELRIGECKLLTDIVEDENDHKSNGLIFPKLETLEIEGCERLECILPVAFPRDVMLLQNIKISKCPKLKHIFYEEGGDIRVSRLQKVELFEVSHLFNISLECYPLLASKVKRPSPRIDFKAKQQDPSKDHHHKWRGASRIKIPMEDGLTQGPKSSISSSEYPPKQSQGLNILVVCNIKQLVLKDLDKIKYLFTLSTASSMMLEILIIDSCHVLKHIIDIEDGSDGKNLKVVFEKLKELSVTGCSQLECMFGEYNAAKDDQNYSEIHIHLPALKKLILQKLPKFSVSSITWTSLKEFVLVRCPYFIVNPISDMMIHFDSRKLVTTTIKDIREIDKHFLTLETLNIEGYQAESIFCVSGVKIIGQVRLGLQFLKLSNLPRMLSICVGSINSFVFQNLKKIQIIRCLRIKVIFQASVSSYLPELESLEIQDCEELEQIVDSPQPYFPKLEVLEVKQCRNLKHLIHASHVPNVRTITIVDCFKLEVIFPDSSLSPLSELEVLEIQYCLNLEKIIEEDKKMGNVDSPQPCFPKLAKLMVKECYNLKRLIHASHLPNVRTIRIVECFKLEVIFPDSFSFLSELEVLEIQVCLRLEKIIEEVKNSPRPCFPKLSVLVVNKCQSLKRLIPASYDVPNLKLLIIIEASELEELMGGGAQRRGDDDVSIRNIIVELPKLKLVIFGKLPEATFKEGIELQTVSDRFVYQCPKLSLKATTTFKEIKKKVLELLNTDLKNFLYQQQYDDMAKVDITVQPDVAQTVSRSDLPYSQINEESEKEFVGEVLDSKVIATKTTPTSLPEVQSIERPSSSLLDIPTNKHVELVDGQSINQPCLMNQQMPFDEIESTIEIPQSEFEHGKSETYTDKENEGHPTNIQDYKDDDLVTSSQTLEHNGNGQIATPYVSVIIAENSTTNNFAVLEETDKSIDEEVARQNGVAISPDSEISMAENFINEPQKKEEILKKQTIGLETERKESHELEDGRSMSEPCLVNQQKPLGETEIPESEIGIKQILADLEESLKMPLKDIASSEMNSLRFLMNLNFFLSRLPLEGVALSEGHKAMIDSLSQESQSILCSFKQVFATSNKFVVLEPHMNEVATMVVSKISKSETFTGKPQQKEATFKEKFFRLEKTATNHPIGLGAQTTPGNDSPSSQVSFKQSMHANLTGYNHNDNGIKLDGSCIASPKIAEINGEPEKDLVGKVPDLEKPVAATTRNSPTDLKQIESTSPSTLDSTQHKTHLHREIKHSQIEISGDEDSEALPTNIQGLRDKDLIKSSLPLVEEHGYNQIHTTCVSDAAADNLCKVLSDVNESLKMPLKDITCSEGNRLRLLAALNYLSNSTIQDVNLSDELKSIIASMHIEPESILYSFKQVFATVDKFVMLEPYLNKVATMNEQINRLQNEIKDCEPKLSCLQKEKKNETATAMRNTSEEIEVMSHAYGKYSIPKCIEVLKILMAEECLNGQQFSYALELLKDDSNRVILMSLKDSRDALVNWILYKYGL